MQTIIENSDKRQQLMQLAVEASPSGMIMVDDVGKILLVNSRAALMFGASAEEMAGKEIESLIPERFRKEHPALRRQYVQSSEARPMGFQSQLFALHSDGHEFPVEIGLTPIDFEGRTLVLAAIVDITERLRAQEMMSLAVEAAPNGMVMTNAEGIIVMVNSCAAELFGYRREELIGLTITDLVPDQYKSKHPALMRSYFESPVSRAMGKGRDLYARKKNGEEIAVEIGINPITTPQGIMVLASIVDITERKQYEESLKAAISEKEVLLSEIHHRVKNNLQIVDSLLAMQMDGVKSEKAVMALRDSQSRIRSMAMIHQTLYQSQDFSGVDIAAVLGQLVSYLASSYAVSQVNVVLEVDEIYMPLDLSIPLGLIVTELVSNAFKYAFDKVDDPVLTVSCKKTVAGAIELIIADNGIGLPDDFENENEDTLGHRLVAALTQQLNGELNIHHQNPTEFCLRFTL